MRPNRQFPSDLVIVTLIDNFIFCEVWSFPEISDDQRRIQFSAPSQTSKMELFQK